MTIAAKSLASSALGQIRSYSRDRSELKEGHTANAVHVLLHIADVTECICTLCLCCCMYFVCAALSVFFRVCSSFDLLRMCYAL